MIDHISIGVSDLARSIAFYDAVLARLGYVRIWSDDDAAGYGNVGTDDSFAIKRTDGAPGIEPRSHVAFVAHDRVAVDAFYEAARALGAKDDGAPQLHPQYGAGYYAAFVRDPDGNRIEAVLHERS